MRETEAFGLCHDFVKHLWKHGQREAAVKKARQHRDLPDPEAETPAALRGP